MKVAISGVNRGIGEGLARGLLNGGDAVIGFGRKRPVWAHDDSGKFKFIECDMADHARLEECCSNVIEPIDVLICSAATFADRSATIERFCPLALGEAFAVNTTAPLVMARALKKKLEAGSRRLIVMISTGNASLQTRQSSMTTLRPVKILVQSLQ